MVIVYSIIAIPGGAAFFGCWFATGNPARIATHTNLVAERSAIRITRAFCFSVRAIRRAIRPVEMIAVGVARAGI